jgi:hypothetical protein
MLSWVYTPPILLRGYSRYYIAGHFSYQVATRFDLAHGTCLLDWDDEGRKLRRIAERFDRASQVRIAG